MNSLCSGARFLSIVTVIFATVMLIGGCIGMVVIGGVSSSLESLFTGGGAAELGMAIVVGLGIVMVLLIGTMAAQAWLLWRANRSLQLVVTTDGADQAHLMSGLRTIKTLFIVEVVLGALSLLGALAGTASAIMAGGGVG